MTDNLSDNSNQRLFSADVPPELKGAHGRSPEVENQIREALQLSEDEFAARLAITNFKSPDYLKGENLVCLLGLARTENLSQAADLISRKLSRICEKIVRDLMRGKGYNENFVEEIVGEMIGDMFAQILSSSGEKSYEFWQVNFFVSLQRLIFNYLRKHGPKAKTTETFTEKSNAENEDDFSFESSLPKFEILTIEQRLEMKEILAKMTDENRLIFIRYRVNDWTQEEIAESLELTSRTVRTRLKQIDELLGEFRSSIEGGKK